MRRIVTIVNQVMLPFRTLPSISALAAGRVEVNALRPVNIEDLLGRDQVNLQWDKIAASYFWKEGTGYWWWWIIGSELCRQILST